MRCAAQIQAVNILKKKLSRTRCKEIVSRRLSRLCGGRRKNRLGGGVRRGTWVKLQERPPWWAFWRRRGLRGNLCRNSPLQHHLGQAPWVNKGAPRRKRVTQTQPTRSDRGAWACPHGARCVGHDWWMQTEYKKMKPGRKRSAQQNSGNG